MNRARILHLLVFILLSGVLSGQTSPFLSGKWAKIGVNKQGIYKLTGAQIRTLGFSLPILSNQLQLFNFNLEQLSDKVPANPNWGLTENAIKVEDGGDGKLDDGDYILFYNQGSVLWKYDSLLKCIRHFKQVSSDTLFYFLTLGDNGKRVGIQNAPSTINGTIGVFNQHYLFETDSISLLNSGKTFWGLPMGQGAGKQAQLNFVVNTQGMDTSNSLKSFVHLASTSYQSNGSFDFLWNDQLSHTTTLLPVTGLLFDDIASVITDSFTTSTNQAWPNKSVLKVNYNSPNVGATGWIDYLEVNAKKPIGFWQDSTIAFNIEEGYLKGSTYNCVIQNVDSTVVIWDVSNPASITQLKLNSLPNTAASFNQKTDSIVHFFGVRQNAFEVPILLGMVPNQNTIPNNVLTNYVIVAAPAYMNAAKKYQAFQQSKFSRNTVIVNAQELYNDFSGGQPSSIAIRNYLKYLSNQAKTNNISPPTYLLLMGMGNFNSKKMNTHFELPVYESENSNSILSSYTTDDFFAVLDDNQDINFANSINQLALAVGRIPARTVAEADSAIEKLIYYQTNTIGGSWENKLSWVADDGDYNLHLQDAEEIVGHLQSNAPNWNHDKIYLDLFPAIATSSGNTYPLAYNAIQQTVQDGTLLINYTGHGNYLRLSEEAVISQPQFDSWNNREKLPLMVTASCNFAPYDQPELSPIAWDALMKNGKGIIGLVAASRLVFAYSNKQINDLFIQQLFVPDSANNYPSIGQALQKAKVKNWAQGGDHINAFKFSLLGDPALRLLSPNYKIAVQQLNGNRFTGRDTLLSGNKYTLQGNIQSGNNVNNSFNGVVGLIIYDAVKYQKTLANQATSMSVPIAVQENILFKGEATVANGVFSIDFILPMQVSNASSPIRLSLVATSNINTAIQIIDSIYVKANSYINRMDTLGPKIKAYLNDPLFKQDAWAAPNSILYIALNDSSGIQTSGNSLGHDLAIWLDDNPIPIVLNNYYVADMDTYKSGTVIYSLPTLSQGKHKCIIKAWDLMGNGSKDTLYFEVPATKDLNIKNAMNFPNPFVNQTKFSIETNQVNKEVQVGLQIMDINGNVLYNTSTKFVNNTTKINIDWNGVTNTGANLQKGVYFYRFTLAADNQVASLTNSCIKL